MQCYFQRLLFWPYLRDYHISTLQILWLRMDTGQLPCHPKKQMIIFRKKREENNALKKGSFFLKKVYILEIGTKFETSGY